VDPLLSAARSGTEVGSAPEQRSNPTSSVSGFARSILRLQPLLAVAGAWLWRIHSVVQQQQPRVPYSIQELSRDPASHYRHPQGDRWNGSTNWGESER